MDKQLHTTLYRTSIQGLKLNHISKMGPGTVSQKYLPWHPKFHTMVIFLAYSFISLFVFQNIWYLLIENVSAWGGLQPPIFGFMPNALTIWAIRARHLLSDAFEYWLWRHKYFFLSKVNIWNVNCVRATAFIIDTRTDVLAKVSTFFRQNMSRPEGDSNSQISDSWERSNYLS